MKKILLTGGPGSAIGAKLLERFHEGDYLTAATFFSADGPKEEAAGANQFLYRLDVSNAEEVEALVSRVEEELGEIDVLINNAGVFAGGLLPITSLGQWERVLQVNLTGTFSACKSVARKMVPRRRGRIINIVSLKGLVGARGASAYSASKAGVIALTKSLARELAPSNISVNAVCPGFITSELSTFDEKLREREQSDSLMDISHNLEDTANFVEFLSSDKLKSVTGQVFHIDSRIH